MSEVDLENELIAAGQDEETAFYKVSRSKKYSHEADLVKPIVLSSVTNSFDINP